MKRVYTRPELISYGGMTQLTLGGSGPQTDYVIQNNQVIAINNNDCTSNAWACATVVS